LSKPIVFSVIESPTHPKLSSLYQQKGYEELQLPSIRKAMNALKKYKPDVIVGEFFYAYGTNYASNHICNLDSLLITLQKYPDYDPKIIVVVSKKDQPFVHKLQEHYKVDHILVQPVTEAQVEAIL
jgi:hypothetical protein